MTKKDYIEFANMFRMLREYRQEHGAKHLPEGCLSIVQVEIGRIFEKDNPRFHFETWNKACFPEIK